MMIHLRPLVPPSSAPRAFFEIESNQDGLRKRDWGSELQLMPNYPKQSQEKELFIMVHQSNQSVSLHSSQKYLCFLKQTNKKVKYNKISLKRYVSSPIL